jgi:hypothetical protein
MAAVALHRVRTLFSGDPWHAGAWQVHRTRSPRVAVATLAEGLGIRAVARVFEVDPNTVLAWLMEVADHGAAFSRYFLHDLQVIQRRVVGVRHRVVFGTLVGVKRVLAATGWQITTAFIERANLAIRQHVAAVGRRVMTLC